MAEALAPRVTPKARRTRAALLAAAEDLFAARGFEATRLEDVAAAVGIRRASIVYYFRDKRALYEGVLESLFGDLHERTAAAFDENATLAAGIEAAVGAWIDTVGERPALARLLLREVADAAPGADTMAPHTRPFFALVERVLAARGDESLVRSPALDPVHVASAIAGGTLFFVAAMPSLVPGGFDPLAPAQLAAHRSAALQIVRRLLGTDAGDDPAPPTPRSRAPHRRRRSENAR